MARKTKMPSRAAPLMTLGERGSRNRRRAAARPTGPGIAGAPTLVTVVIGSSLPPGARVKQHGDEIADHVRAEHRERNDQEQALEQRVVVVVHRLLQHVADTGVAE